VDAFALNILEGAPYKVQGEEGLKDIKVVEAMYQSICKKGRRVFIVIWLLMR
jgi:predicted dehydrogenase